MEEIVIISGKGGTGKTSVTGSLAALLEDPVIADCDVDAADLHLILSPRIVSTTPFVSGKEPQVDGDRCTGCGVCESLCGFGAITRTDGSCQIDPLACEGCGLCVAACPETAITFGDRLCGRYHWSETRFGPMIHPEMEIGAENSGRLVSLIRQEGRRKADTTGAKRILIDGPPGIGCPVIASITGADRVLVVTEPTVSGLHDLERVLDLTDHFRVPAWVCVNKWDLNPVATAEIRKLTKARNAEWAGRIPYTGEMTRAQLLGKTASEVGSEKVTGPLHKIKAKIAP